jgi:hypothetical protein
MPNFVPTHPSSPRDSGMDSDFVHHLDDLLREADEDLARAAPPSPSLMQELQRCGQVERPTELLEVLAASLQRRQPLTAHLRHPQGLTTLTVFPVERLARCPIPLRRLMAMRLNELEVQRVEPFAEGAPGDVEHHYAPLGPLSWEIALRGARGALLPEIPPLAVYRVAPGADLREVELAGSLGAAVARLRRAATTLRELSSWPGFDHERATRLLNALYLQSALIVSAASP